MELVGRIAPFFRFMSAGGVTALFEALVDGEDTARAVAARNLALCFPALDDAARAALLREHFAALGIGLFEFARAWWGSIAPMRPTISPPRQASQQRASQ